MYRRKMPKYQNGRLYTEYLINFQLLRKMYKVEIPTLLSCVTLCCIETNKEAILAVPFK